MPGKGAGALNYSASTRVSSSLRGAGDERWRGGPRLVCKVELAEQSCTGKLFTCKNILSTSSSFHGFGFLAEMISDNGTVHSSVKM